MIHFSFQHDEDSTKEDRPRVEKEIVEMDKAAPGDHAPPAVEKLLRVPVEDVPHFKQQFA